MTVFDGLRALLQRSSDDEDVKLQRFVVSADRVGDELRLRAQTREGSGVALWSVSYAPTAMEQLVLASNSFSDALSALQAVATAIEHPHDMQRQSARVIVAADGQSLDVRPRGQARLTTQLIVRLNRKDAVTFTLARSDEEPESEWALLCSVLERRVAIDKAMTELNDMRASALRHLALTMQAARPASSIGG